MGFAAIGRRSADVVLGPYSETGDGTALSRAQKKARPS